MRFLVILAFYLMSLIPPASVPSRIIADLTASVRCQTQTIVKDNKVMWCNICCDSNGNCWITHCWE